MAIGSDYEIIFKGWNYDGTARDYDVSTFLREVDMQLSQELHDATSMGDKYRGVEPGLALLSLSVSFYNRPGELVGPTSNQIELHNLLWHMFSNRDRFVAMSVRTHKSEPISPGYPSINLQRMVIQNLGLLPASVGDLLMNGMNFQNGRGGTVTRTTS